MFGNIAMQADEHALHKVIFTRTAYPRQDIHLSLTPPKTIRVQRSWGRCQVLGVQKLARLRRLLVWWEIQRKAFRHPSTTIRTNRRIVFRDCCSNLYSLMDYAKVCFSNGSRYSRYVVSNQILYLFLSILLLALNHLRLADYVHQNISPGNCLYTKDLSDVIQIKILNLEYARLYSMESPHMAPIPVHWLPA